MKSSNYRESTVFTGNNIIAKKETKNEARGKENNQTRQRAFDLKLMIIEECEI